jgi:hypothetical protein
MNSPTASDKIYSIFFKYEHENSVEENCWEVAKSSKEKNARNYLVKTEEVFTFCSLFRREKLIDSYSSKLYIDDSKEGREQAGFPLFKIKPDYLGSLVKIPSKPSGLFKPHPPNKQQDLDGDEYFSIINHQYHNIEF